MADMFIALGVDAPTAEPAPPPPAPENKTAEAIRADRVDKYEKEFDVVSGRWLAMFDTTKTAEYDYTAYFKMKFLPKVHMKSGKAGGTKCDCARCNATTRANEKGFLTPESVAKETLTPLDLINVPIGKLYAKLKHTVVASGAEDAGEPMYGHLSMLARLHIGQDQAESICERVISTANQIMTIGNTLLKRMRSSAIWWFCVSTRPSL